MAVTDVSIILHLVCSCLRSVLTANADLTCSIMNMAYIRGSEINSKLCDQIMPLQVYRLQRAGPGVFLSRCCAHFWRHFTSSDKTCRGISPQVASKELKTCSAPGEGPNLQGLSNCTRRSVLYIKAKNRVLFEGVVVQVSGSGQKGVTNESGQFKIANAWGVVSVETLSWTHFASMFP